MTGTVLDVVLPSVVRRAGLPVVERHRPGTPDGLAAVVRLAGLADARSTRHGAPEPGAPVPGAAGD